MGVHAIYIVNNHGQPRLIKRYTSVEDLRMIFASTVPLIDLGSSDAVRRTFQHISKRSDALCNFIEPDQQHTTGVKNSGSNGMIPPGMKLVYRHYATLYFIFLIDQAESELGILDLIQVFVEALDKCFENAGSVLETSLKEILKAVNGAAEYARDTEATAAQVSQIGRLRS